MVAHVKVQAPSAPAGRFGKDAFEIDLEAKPVRCPAGVLVQIREHGAGGGGIACVARRARGKTSPCSPRRTHNLARLAKLGVRHTGAAWAR